MPAVSRFPKLRRFMCGSVITVLAVSGLYAGSDSAAHPPSTALTARSGPRGPTLFATLPPEQTGLKAFNAYDDPAMWGKLYHEFNSGAIGTGVAIGDYDGDGFNDILIGAAGVLAADVGHRPLQFALEDDVLVDDHGDTVKGLQLLRVDRRDEQRGGEDTREKFLHGIGSGELSKLPGPTEAGGKR